MARKRYSDEDALKVLREIDIHLHDGFDVVSACRKAGIADKTYYYWRKKFGASTASSAAYFISGLSIIGNSSFGIIFVAGRKRIPKLATGRTAFVIRANLHTTFLV